MATVFFLVPAPVISACLDHLTAFIKGSCVVTFSQTPEGPPRNKVWRSLFSEDGPSDHASKINTFDTSTGFADHVSPKYGFLAFLAYQFSHKNFLQNF
jgi:hypothetical protein